MITISSRELTAAGSAASACALVCALAAAACVLALAVSSATAAPGPAARNTGGRPATSGRQRAPSQAVAPNRGWSDPADPYDGRAIPAEDLHKVMEKLRPLRETRQGIPPRTIWSVKPAATGTPIATGSDLAAALQGTDTQTLQLPSGRRITVGQLRLLKHGIEQRLGRTLESLPGRPNLAGHAIPVGPGADFQQILHRSDADVLVSPHGIRITVGELKKALASAKPSGASTRSKTGRAGGGAR